MACAALRESLGRFPQLRRDELLAAARLLLSAQPEMAPILRLALECRRAATSRAAFARLPAVLASFDGRLRTASTALASHFEKALPRRRRVRIAMYSFSGTVIHAIIHAKARISEVLCAEGRPNWEGRHAATELSQAGLRVALLTDAAWMNSIEGAAAVSVGADAITERGFLNKVGTSAAVHCARVHRIPVYVLADSSKFLPASAARRFLKIRSQAGPRGEVWPHAPGGVRIENPYLAWTPWQAGVCWLSESGKKSLSRARERSSRPSTNLLPQPD